VDRLKYASVEEARSMRGLRLVLSSGVPGPWGEAAKYFFSVKGLAYTPVEQVGGGENAQLRAWTGQTSAPVAAFDDEPPVWVMSDILFLAERLAPEPALIPADARERAFMFGLCREISGRDGLGWSRRLMQFHARRARASERDREFARRYGYSEAAGEAAPARVAQILHLLSETLREQRRLGRSFLVGERLSAADLMWAAFSNALAPLPHEVCPMPAWLRALFSLEHPDVRAALDPALLEHRDRVFRDGVGLPLDF
jgi:glutathione S-transferase